MEHENRIRQLVLDGKSHQIRRLLLNSNQIELVDSVRRQEFLTASDLSVQLDISIQNASSKLNRLYQSGYLDRLEVSAKSGGLEYHYRY